MLSGAGQVLCAASPKAGAWFLLAFALFSPEAALGAVLGLVVATVTAVMTLLYFLIRSGLLGNRR